MPITPTYPGIYIEELPSNSHTIVSAPTSIAVFIGYSHPFKTKTTTFNTAVQVFSPTDYERSLGGFFNAPSRYADPNFSSLPQAINQFFLNGGSQAYVVGLKLASYITTESTTEKLVSPVDITVGGVTFTAREITGDPDKDKHPEDASWVMNIEVSNVRKTNNDGDTADVKVTYGLQAEIFRNVNLITGDGNFIESRIGTDDKPISSLITVKAGQTFTATSKFTKASGNFDSTIKVSDGSTFTRFFEPADFITVFKQDSDLDKLPIFNLMVLPGVTDGSVLSEALAFCERKRAFFIMDAPSVDNADSTDTHYIGTYIGTVPLSPNGALYFPYLKATDPLTNLAAELPPAAYVAGIYSKTDQNRGVWKAPAGLETTLLNTSGVVDRGRMNDNRQGTLNPLGVNCLRSFPGSGTVVFGARTLVTANPAFEQWRYVPVRRMALFIEQTLFNNLTWVIFEPNDEPLWM